MKLLLGLGTWVCHQRGDERSNSPERIAELEGLPGWEWSVTSEVSK